MHARRYAILPLLMALLVSIFLHIFVERQQKAQAKKKEVIRASSKNLLPPPGAKQQPVAASASSTNKVLPMAKVEEGAGAGAGVASDVQVENLVQDTPRNDEVGWVRKPKATL